MPDTFYHGTRRGFSRGGYLFPRSLHNGPGTAAPLNPGMKSPDDADQWCYVTRDPDVAWAYAQNAPGQGRPKILIVTPRGKMERDPEHGPRTDAWRCESARVERIIKITEAE